MNPYLETAFGVIKAIPDVVKASEILWSKLAPPPQAQVDDPKDGIDGNTFYSDDHKFAISIPGDEWWFWRPTMAFLLTMGPALNRPTIAAPIMILSKQVISLFRANVVVTVEEVGEYANVRELIEMSVAMLDPSGKAIQPSDVNIDDTHQSGVLGFAQPYHLGKTLCTLQQFYLRRGALYTITATYAPTSPNSKAPYGSLQEILNSFKFIEGKSQG